MVRLKSDEVGDARSVLDPLLDEILPAVEADMNTGGELGLTTVELILRHEGREARCVVTFEAWERARTNPDQLRVALRQVATDLQGSEEVRIYLFTSRGLEAAPTGKDRAVLGAIAHGIEADVLAERFFKQGLRK